MSTKNDDDLPRRDEQASSNGVATASAVREGCAHTPAPWYVGAQNDALFVIAGRAPSMNNDYPVHDAVRTVIARIEDGDKGYTEADANAAFIVRACNSHAELLAALKTVSEHMDRAGGDRDGMPECPWCKRGPDGDEHNGDCELLAARSAIAKAEHGR